MHGCLSNRLERKSLMILPTDHLEKFVAPLDQNLEMGILRTHQLTKDDRKNSENYALRKHHDAL